MSSLLKQQIDGPATMNVAHALAAVFQKLNLAASQLAQLPGKERQPLVGLLGVDRAGQLPQFDSSPI